MLRCLILALLVPLASHAAVPDPGAEAFKREIDVRLEVPAREQSDYAKRLDAALKTLEVTGLTTRYARWSNAIGGVALLAIGALLVFRPEWLAFA